MGINFRLYSFIFFHNYSLMFIRPSRKRATFQIETKNLICFDPLITKHSLLINIPLIAPHISLINFYNCYLYCLPEATHWLQLSPFESELLELDPIQVSQAEVQSP